MEPMHKKLLIVDDDLLFRQMLVEILETQGYKITDAENGEEGVQTFVKFHPDLVITDIRMPKKNGLQMAQEILRYSPNTPIIFISGWFDIDGNYTENKSFFGQESFCIHFLKKPFRVPQLLKLISEIETPCKDHALHGQPS